VRIEVTRNCNVNKLLASSRPLFSSSTITKMDPKELNVKYIIAAIIHSKHIPIRRTGYLTNKQIE
jgi:hypothetical protein